MQFLQKLPEIMIPFLCCGEVRAAYQTKPGWARFRLIRLGTASAVAMEKCIR
jgi:hypothetical protein